MTRIASWTCNYMAYRICFVGSSSVVEKSVLNEFFFWFNFTLLGRERCAVTLFRMVGHILCMF